MQHRLLVLGSMDEFVELVRTAQRRGIYVIACDGYDDGPAKPVADAAFTIDVRNTQAIAQLCREQRVDGIITSFSDLLAECMANICAATGLPGYVKPEGIRYLREKPLMKQMFQELGIPSPASVCVHRDTLEHDLAQVGFPCVVKPANGYGSRGVYVLESAEQVRERFDEIVSYSAFDYLLAEEYNRGFEINMMNWIVDGEPVVLGMADREKTQDVPFAIPHVSRNAYPSRFAADAYDQARDIIRKVAAYTGIDCGPMSMQFFWEPGKGIQVCEIAGRLFGYEHELVTYGSGLSIEELLIDWVYDRDALRARLAGHTPFYDRCSAVIYFHGHEGTVGNVDAACAAADLPGMEDALVFYQPGDVVGHGVGAKPYVARYYVSAPDRAALDALTAQLYGSVTVTDDAGNNLLHANRMLDYDAALAANGVDLG
ncbi:MAG: ATP-grasp domain-containing protein [Coriobacteriia bacterium]|nr:ATP-grasp domain-containing protein [Coriobacteriia bacterium]